MRTPPADQLQFLDAMTAAAGLADLSPETGVVVQNAGGEIVAASAQAEHILGLSFAQMQGRTSRDPRWAAIDEHGEPVPGAQHPAMLALEIGVAIRGSVIGVHRPGSEAPGHHVWLDVQAVPVAEDHADPSAVVTAFCPITGDRLQALALRDSERLFRMIAEHSSDMVAWQLVADFTFLWVSPASRTVLGIDSDDLVGVRCADIVHPDDRAELQQWQRTVSEGGPAPTLTLRMRHADGTYRWIERTAHVLPVHRGSPPQMITTQRDVTDRVAAEQARDAAMDLFELAMEHATIGVALGSIDGTIIRGNPALCAILGRDASELIGHHLGEFASDIELDGDCGLGAGDGASVDHVGVEQQFRRPDGTTVWCAKAVIPLPHKFGDVTHVLVQLQDITARREATAQLEKAALTDTLTGLPNRTVLEERLSRALATAQRTGTRVGVLFIDLDGFKHINDTYGHEVGDTLLTQVGMQLVNTVRHTDTVVRLGGDEFVVVREHLTNPAELDRLYNRVVEVFAEPFYVNGRVVTIAASVGAATGHTATARELLTRADRAMYQFKRHRPGPHMHDTATTDESSFRGGSRKPSSGPFHLKVFGPMYP